tara:strand:- start:50 stop:256 length:207 start_codon:yes stop_codon:yes gene_type:complete
VGFSLLGDLMAPPRTQVERMKGKSRFYNNYARKCTQDGKDRKSMEAKIDQELMDEHIEEMKEEIWFWK